MFSFLYSSSTKIGSKGITKLGKPRVPSYMYLEELDTNSDSKLLRRGCVDDERKILLQTEVSENKEYISANNNKSLIKVKVLMTKDEAARLLSKCKNGGTLNFKDVAHELVQIPTSRVSVVSTGTTSRALESVAKMPQKYD